MYEQLLAISRKLQYKQLVEAGALGRLPFIGIDLLDKDISQSCLSGDGRCLQSGCYGALFRKRL